MQGIGGAGAPLTALQRLPPSGMDCPAGDGKRISDKAAAGLPTPHAGASCTDTAPCAAPLKATSSRPPVATGAAAAAADMGAPRFHACMCLSHDAAGAAGGSLEPRQPQGGVAVPLPPAAASSAVEGNARVISRDRRLTAKAAANAQEAAVKRLLQEQARLCMTAKGVTYIPSASLPPPPVPPMLRVLTSLLHGPVCGTGFQLLCCMWCCSYIARC